MRKFSSPRLLLPVVIAALVVVLTFALAGAAAPGPSTQANASGVYLTVLPAFSIVRLTMPQEMVPQPKISKHNTIFMIAKVLMILLFPPTRNGQ